MFAYTRNWWLQLLMILLLTGTTAVSGQESPQRRQYLAAIDSFIESSATRFIDKLQSDRDGLIRIFGTCTDSYFEPRYRISRENFIREFLEFTDIQLRNIFFTDGKPFEIFGKDGMSSEKVRRDIERRVPASKTISVAINDICDSLNKKPGQPPPFSDTPPDQKEPDTPIPPEQKQPDTPIIESPDTTVIVTPPSGTTVTGPNDRTDSPDPAAKKNYTWLWIVLGVVAATASWFLIPLFIPRAPKKIIAFHMHKDEEALIDQMLPDGEKTEGFTVAKATKAKIKKMRDLGLALQVLNTSTLFINTPGGTKTVKYKLKKGIPEGEPEITTTISSEGNFRNIMKAGFDKPTVDFPAFYIITLDGPMLPGYKMRLKDIGINIVQYMPQNSYIVLIPDENKLDKLKFHPEVFDFIRMINYYSAFDTGVIIKEDDHEKTFLVLDLILHRQEDKDEVLGFLEKENIPVVNYNKDSIRIRVPAKSDLKFQLAANKYIQAIYEYVPPVLCNDLARQLVGVDSGNSLTNLEETGDGEIVGVADSGIDVNHPDLKNHIIETTAWGRKRTKEVSDRDGHGTHVTGSIAGDGFASKSHIKGIAPGAKIFFQSLMNEQGSVFNPELRLEDIFLEAYNKQARIHNNSWSSESAARYTALSLEVDRFVYEHPDMLIVVAAGNDGICDDPMKNNKGYVKARTIGSPGTNKNGITVGASRSNRSSGGFSTSTYGKKWPKKFTDAPTSDELISGNPEALAAFSSRGPCDDNRMKPDIVAPGTDILSAKSSLATMDHFYGEYEINHYAYMGGTSMAAPIVAGAAAIVREYYRKKKSYAQPSAALIKATLINGTKKLSGPDANRGSDKIPNWNQGFGMLNMLTTIPNSQNNFSLEYRDTYRDTAIQYNETGQEYALRFEISQPSWIRVCMAYTDDPARGIQNDLDLIIDHRQTKQKWYGNNGINVKDQNPTEEDRTNNVEIIRIDNANPGLYTVKIFAHNILLTRQSFALVVTTSDLSCRFM